MGGGVVVVVAAVKVAVTDADVLPLSEHAAVPVQPPLHPENVEPDAAAAVSVTTVPGAYVAEQEVPQLIPAGLLVTVPDPVPAFVTVTANPAGLAQATFEYAEVPALSVARTR